MEFRKVAIRGPDGKLVEGLDIPILESTERFSEFTLADGTVLRVKPLIISAARMENQWDQDDNPIYVCKNQVVIAVKHCLDSLRRKS